MQAAGGAAVIKGQSYMKLATVVVVCCYGRLAHMFLTDTPVLPMLAAVIYVRPYGASCCSCNSGYGKSPVSHAWPAPCTADAGCTVHWKHAQCLIVTVTAYRAES